MLNRLNQSITVSRLESLVQGIINKGSKKNMATDKQYDSMVRAASISTLRAEISALIDEKNSYLSMGEPEWAREVEVKIKQMQNKLNAIL